MRLDPPEHTVMHAWATPASQAAHVGPSSDYLWGEAKRFTLRCNWWRFYAA